MSEDKKRDTKASVSKINAMLKKALKFKDRNRKVLYIISMAQLLQAEAQMQQLLELPEEGT